MMPRTLTTATIVAGYVDDNAATGVVTPGESVDFAEAIGPTRSIFVAISRREISSIFPRSEVVSMTSVLRRRVNSPASLIGNEL